MNKDEEILLEEQHFPHIEMSRDEMLFYLNNIIKNCKDICDTDNEVNGSKKCKILELKFKKYDSVIYINGFMVINGENRCIDGKIIINSDDIIVRMDITRLCVDCEHKVYETYDQFKLDNGDIIRRSYYNYNLESTYKNIHNKQLEGKLK